MGQNTSFRSKKNDHELTLQHTTTDSPILPIAQILELKEHLPERVDFVFEQTRLEAEHRRAQENRINLFVFAERLIGSFFGLITVGAAFGFAYVMAMANKDWVAATVVGTTLVSVFATFVAGRSAEKKKTKPTPAITDNKQK